MTIFLIWLLWYLSSLLFYLIATRKAEWEIDLEDFKIMSIFSILSWVWLVIFIIYLIISTDTFKELLNKDIF
jgi:hypothetical protein